MKMRAVFCFCILISSSVMAARAPATYSDSDPGTIDTRYEKVGFRVVSRIEPRRNFMLATRNTKKHKGYGAFVPFVIFVAINHRNGR